MTTAAPVQSAALGLVYRDLGQHLEVVTRLLTDPHVASFDFSVQAPVYKGTPAIVEALKSASGLREKIEVYFRHGLLDEATRLRFGQAFRNDYARKHPRVERQDIFAASAGVVGMACDLVPPLRLTVPREAFDAIAAGPHDPGLLAKLRGGDLVDGGLWRTDIRLFLDHALNPRRHGEAAVRAAALAVDAPQPFVLEVATVPGVAGYAASVLAPLVEAAGGRLVWLET